MGQYSGIATPLLLRDPIWRAYSERTGNLYALHLPGLPLDIGLQPDMTPVNTLRLPFNTYFAAALPLLDDRSYFATWHYPDLILNLTETRDSRDSCAYYNSSGQVPQTYSIARSLVSPTA